MRNESWLRLMSGLVLVGVFAAGTLFGAGLMKWTAPPPDRLPPPPRPPSALIEVMKQKLALTEAQVREMQAIIQAHRPELEAIAHKTQDEVRDLMFEMENELVPKLEPDQKQRLEEWRKIRPPMGPPGMGPPGMAPPGMGPPPPR